LRAEGSWNKSKHEYTLSVQQILPSNEEQGQALPYLIPLKISLLNSQGNPIPLQQKDEAEQYAESCVLRVSEVQQDFVFCNVTELPTPSLLQEFSAPVRLEYNYSTADYAFLMSNDIDLFNRWDAGQQFATGWLLSAIEAFQQNKPLPAINRFVAALVDILKDKNLDPALVAEMLILPQESYLAECVKPIDVDAIYQTRRELQKRVAKALENTLLSAYQSNMLATPYRYNQIDMGKRKLAAVCLMYLNLLESDQYFELSKTQYKRANNMTDAMAALEAVNDFDNSFRKQLMDSFEERWKHDSLVMDKWFSLQARSRQRGVLNTVKTLLDHPCFSIKNPNNVRALIGAFANANPTALHSLDGSGYAFLTEQILRLDTINPQIAAGIVRPLIDWRKHDLDRQHLMKEVLHTIMAAPKLSNDVYELVNRSINNITNK